MELQNRHPNGKGRVYPMQPVPDREASYHAALELVAHIDEQLTRGTCHYRNKAGLLLTTLDEVVNAILADDLMLPEAEPVWTPQQIAA